LLSGNFDQRQECTFTTQKTSPHTSIEEVYPGNYVIASPGESYSLQCVGHRGWVVGVFEAKVYIEQIPNQCKMFGATWQIAGEIRRSTSLLSTFEVIQVTPLNLKQQVHPLILQKISQHSWTKLKDLSEISVDEVELVTNENSINNINWDKVSDHTTWGTAIVVFLLTLTVLIFVCVGCKYYNRKRKTFRYPTIPTLSRSEDAMPHETEISTVNLTGDDVLETTSNMSVHFDTLTDNVTLPKSGNNMDAASAYQPTRNSSTWKALTFNP
jgi:hypothetical protein